VFVAELRSRTLPGLRTTFPIVLHIKSRCVVSFRTAPRTDVGCKVAMSGLKHPPAIGAIST
jgi:hypothetical protein